MFDEVTGSKYYENILIYKLFVYFSQKNNSKEVNVEVDIELLYRIFNLFTRLRFVLLDNS